MPPDFLFSKWAGCTTLIFKISGSDICNLCLNLQTASNTVGIHSKRTLYPTLTAQILHKWRKPPSKRGSCGLLGAHSDCSQHQTSTCGRFPWGRLGRNVRLLGASCAVDKGRQEYTWAYPTGLSKISCWQKRARSGEEGQIGVLHTYRGEEEP